MGPLRGYLTTKEAAERLGVTESHVCRLVRQGRLEAVRVGQRALLIRNASIRTLKRRPPGRPRKQRPTEGGQ